MKKFTDNQGFEWEIDFNVGALLRLRKLELDFLAEPQNEKNNLATRLATDHLFLFQTLWPIVGQQDPKPVPTEEQFGKRIGPDTLISARTAIFEEWAEFFTKLNKGPAATAVSKTLLFQVTSEDVMARQVANSEPLNEMTARFATQLEAKLSREFAKLPAALEKAMTDLEADEMVDVKVV